MLRGFATNANFGEFFMFTLCIYQLTSLSCDLRRVHRCFLCKFYARDETMWRCGKGPCGKFYHHSCLRKWHRTLGLVTQHDTSLCPRHCFCGKGDECDGPDAEALDWKCLRCPVVYHDKCRPLDVHVIDFGSKLFSCK